MDDGSLISRGAKHALDPSLYCSQDAFDQEKSRIFRKSWRLIGHENMLASPGDYVADAIAGAPVFAIRDETGAVNGFHNVCRHRAGPLVNEGEGHCDGVIACKYHGWRYALDGRLRNARDFGSAPGFDPRDYSLYPVKLDFWRGFIFANLDDDAPSIAEELAPIEAGWPSDVIQPFAFRRSHDISCNWKTYVENYLEGYHVPDVHPGLDRDVDSTKYRVEMIGSVAVHHAPPRNKGAVYAGYWAWVWPWLGVNVYSHGVMMERITPLGPQQTRLDYLYFFDANRRDELEAMTALSDEVTAEDKMICEQVQRNLEAGVYEPGPLSPRHENAVAWFQDKLRSDVGY